MGRKEFRKSRPALNLLPSWYLLLSAPPTRRTAPPPTGHQQLARVVKVPLSIGVVLRKNTVDAKRSLPTPNREKILAMQTSFSREHPASGVPSYVFPTASGISSENRNIRRCNLPKKLTRLSPRTVPPSREQGKGPSALYLLFGVSCLLGIGLMLYYQAVYL